MKIIPVFRPSMGQEEIKAVAKVIQSGWIGLGPKTEEFEKKFANYVGAKYAVALNSATAALHLAFMLLDIRGKEVITTPMTFISTNHAILYNGGRPVFTDICRDTLNIDPLEIKKNITKNTKAIVVVHYGGHACQMEEILDIAKKNNLYVVEDAAHACGAWYKDKKLGTLGDIGCFSFHAVKNLATADGGMLVTDNKEWYDRVKKLRWVGISKDTWAREEIQNKHSRYSWYYHVEELGFKCHMNDINAAIGLVQLKKLDALNRKRRMLSRRYNEKFGELKWLESPVEKNYAKSSLHNYAIKTDYRNELNDFLSKKGISTSVHYIPNNHYPMYKKFGRPTPIAEEVWTKLLLLPLYPDMTVRQQDRVISCIKEFGKKYVKNQ